MNKVLIIGAGFFQLDGITKAKALGCQVIAVDGNPHAAGKELADEFHHMDVKDKDSICQLAKDKAVNAVIAIASEISLEAMSYVVSQLGLPGYHYETIEISHNKNKYFSIFKKNQISIPETKTYTKQKDLENLSYEKVVIKPSKGSGSRGVQVTQDIHTFDFEKYKKDNLKPDEVILLQKFIEGKELTVDGFVSEGSFKLYAVSEEINDEHKGHTFSSELIFPPLWMTEDIQQKIVSICNQIANCMHIKSGPMHMEFKYDETGQLFVIDFSLRGGGFDVFTRIVELSGGYDIVTNYIKAALGRKIDYHDVINFKPVTLSFIYPEESGIITSIDGKEYEGLFDDYWLKFLYDEGECVEKPSSGKQRLAYYICWGDDYDRVFQRRDWVKNAVKFHIE